MTPVIVTTRLASTVIWINRDYLLDPSYRIERGEGTRAPASYGVFPRIVFSIRECKFNGLVSFELRFLDFAVLATALTGNIVEICVVSFVVIPAFLRSFTGERSQQILRAENWPWSWWRWSCLYCWQIRTSSSLAIPDVLANKTSISSLPHGITPRAWSRFLHLRSF
jgi:hypothetical protein